MLEKCLILPEFKRGDKVSVVVYSKWTPCIACGARLDVMFEQLLSRLRTLVGENVQKFFVSNRTYTSIARGFANADRQHTGNWNLVLIQPRKEEAEVSTEKNDEHPTLQRGEKTPKKETFRTFGTPSSHLNTLTPDTVSAKMRLIDQTGKTPTQSHGSTQTTPPGPATRHRPKPSAIPLCENWK